FAEAGREKIPALPIEAMERDVDFVLYAIAEQLKQRFVPDDLYLAVAVVHRRTAEPLCQIGDEPGWKRSASVVRRIVRAPVGDLDAVERRDEWRVREIDDSDPASGATERCPEHLAFLLRRQEVSVYIFAARCLPRIVVAVSAGRQRGVERRPN